VFIYADDQALDGLGCYGGKALTPHIDSLARDGVRFERFYISSAVCSPSRYSLLTGRYASRSNRCFGGAPAGGPINIGWQAGVFGEKRTMPKILKANGYRTGFVGKWHQGTEPFEKLPSDASRDKPETIALLERNYQKAVDAIRGCGFDYAASVYAQNVEAGGKPWLPKGMQHHNQEWVTAGALEFIEQSKDVPFFLYMPTTLIHGPSPLKSMQKDPRITTRGLLKEAPQVQPSRESVFKRVADAGLEPHWAGTTWLDDAVGAVLDKLKQLGLEDNTIVFYASDNGRKGKFSCYDAGARMPFLVRWPGKIPKGTVRSELASNVDIAATVYDVCGITPPEKTSLNGKSILPLLLGKGEYSRESLFLEVTSERAVVSDDNFKYMAVRFGPKIQEQVDAGVRYTHWGLKMDENVHHTYNAEVDYPCYFDKDQLYDLTNDPDELVNLAGKPEHKERLERMKAMLKEYCDGLPHSFGEFKVRSI